MDYQGYKLTPNSQQRQDNAQWTTEIDIFRNYQNMRFTGTATFETEAEASVFSIEYGKQIIDGKYPDCELKI